MQTLTATARREPGGPPGVACGDHLRRALVAARRIDAPYRHWLLSGVLPDAVARLVAALPFAVPAIGDTVGRRETHNQSRTFFGPETQRRLPATAAVAEAFQHPCTVALIAAMTGIDVAGTFLRIEYCQDTEGFWLEPHTDIGAKKLTLLVYLSTDPGSEDWGTDIYADPRGRPVGRAPAGFGAGLMFVPGDDSWHGFEPRTIVGVRRSLIVNLVGPEWRTRHELAFPDRPVA